MRPLSSCRFVVVVLTLLAMCDSARARAQSPVPPLDDKTGTNPLNLQQNVSASNVFESLSDARFVDRVPYRWTVPLARRRLAVGVELPLVFGNTTGRTEMAFGDVGTRVVWTPWLSPERGVLTGVDITWSTATNDALGAGRGTLAPFAQVVFTPSQRTIVAPRYEHRLSVSGSTGPDVNEATIGLYAAWRSADQTWIVVDPQIVIDVDREQTSGLIALEYGRLLFGGVSTFVRPHLGLGSVSIRPFDWAVELGFRIIQ